MSYKFNQQAFKKQSKKSSAVVDVKRTAKAEVMRFLYAVRPQAVVDIIRLQKIAIANPNEFEDFIKLYLNDKIDFDSDKFLSQIKISNIDILRAKKNFLGTPENVQSKQSIKGAGKGAGVAVGNLPTGATYPDANP